MISLMYILALSQIVSLCHVKKPGHKRSIVKFSSNIQTALLQNKHPSPWKQQMQKMEEKLEKFLFL